MSTLAAIKSSAMMVPERKRQAAAAIAPLPSIFPADESSKKAMLLVTLAHLAVPLAFFLSPSPVPQLPVLSFTVTLMDLSASQNSVSSSASAQSSPTQKPQPKESATPSPAAPSKTSSALSHNSAAQTAVIAPVTPAQFDAAYLQNPKPAYPALSRRMGEQGSVFLSVYVNGEGKVQEVRLKKSSGFDRLDNAALEAVSRWRFASAKQGGRLIASWVTVPVQFILE